MSLDLFIPFLIATAILLATPGPTILLVVSYALAQGRGVALAVVGGVILGDLLAMSATLLGLGVVMTASASLFTVMKWAGAAYLAWMGWRMVLFLPVAVSSLIVAMLLQPLPADWPQWTLAPKSWPGILALWLLLSLFGSTACTMLRRRRSRRRARRKRLTRAGI